MQQLTEPGDVISYVAAGVTVQLQLTVDGGYARNVLAGPTRIDELAASHADEQIARAQARQIAEALKAGITVDQIAVAHVADGQTVIAVAEEIVTEALRVATADPDTIAAEPTVAALQDLLPADDGMDELAARVRATMAAAGSLVEARTELSGQPSPTLADTVPATGIVNQPAVASKPTSAPMDRIVFLAAASDGYVARGGNADDGEADSTQLLALHKRGIVRLTRERRGNRVKITGGWLTVKGWKLAGVSPKAEVSS